MGLPVAGGGGGLQQERDRRGGYVWPPPQLKAPRAPPLPLQCLEPFLLPGDPKGLSGLAVLSWGEGSLLTTWVQALRRGQSGRAAAALSHSVLWVQIPAFGERGTAFPNRIGRRNCLPLGEPGGRWPRCLWEGAWEAFPGWEEAVSTLGGEGAARLLCPLGHPLLLTRSCLSPFGPTRLAPHGGSCPANPLQETLGHVGHQPWGRDGERGSLLSGVQVGSPGVPAQHRHSRDSKKGQPCQSWAMAAPAPAEPKCPAPHPVQALPVGSRRHLGCRGPLMEPQLLWGWAPGAPC